MQRRLLLLCLIITAVISIGPDARGQDDQTDELPDVAWQLAFSPISSARLSDHLFVMAITNDDPFRSRILDPTKKKQANRKPGETTKHNELPEFAFDISTAYREAASTRKDWREKLHLQWMPCGLPLELTGSAAAPDVSRVIILVCNSDYRVLAMTVGIPTTGQLVSLLEDAEESRRLLADTVTDELNLLEPMVSRSRARLTRTWQDAFDEAVDSWSGSDEQRQDDVSKRIIFNETFQLCETFKPTYLADASLRFGLDEPSDWQRLAILEHHCQTRRPWSEALTPFLIGRHAKPVSSALAESIWGHAAIHAVLPNEEARFAKFSTWVADQMIDTAVVLSIKPPAASRYLAWPPIPDDQQPLTSKWREAHHLATAQPHRLVDLQTLAYVIAKNDFVPVDVRGINVRYVVLFPNRKTIRLVRENESPTRFAGLLKRNRSRLVNQ